MRRRPDDRREARCAQARARLDELTERERDVLALIAEVTPATRSARLFVSPKTVEGHISQIFAKLDLRDTPDQHRRVLAVLAWLRG